MTADPTFPIFVFDGNDLSLFGDFNSITTDLEGVDVEDGRYAAFDATGRAVVLKAVGVLRGRFSVEIGRVLVGDESTTPSVQEFENRLRLHLHACGRIPRTETSMRELVQACKELAGYRDAAV